MTPGVLRILYVGGLFDGSTALHRLEGMRDLGQKVVAIDAVPGPTRNALRRFSRQVVHKMFGLRDWYGANWRMLEAVRRDRFDVVWIDKGLTIRPDTLREIRARQPECRIAGYSPDDMMNPGNQTPQFLACLPLYDVYFTTKSFHLDELPRLGCPRAVFVPNAYDPRLHRPVAVTAEERRLLGGPVGFIGTAERERGESMRFLASQGVDVKVWGNGWEAYAGNNGHLTVAGGSQFGERYTKIICSFDINLCFLRKVNRDLQTQRSAEIPACGAFMLAERTDEHLALFEEGKEAEFFSSDQELLEKTQYYLAHPQERQRIAAAGYERCVRGGYSNQKRMRQCLEALFESAGTGP